MTGGEVENILRERIIKAEPPISGGVYFKEMRTRHDNTGGLEDCEVMVLTGKGLDKLEGTCVVNIYVPDTLTASGLYLRSKRRTDALEKWLETLPQTIRDGSIYFTRDGLITTIKEPDTKEHFVSLKMRFKVIEENF